VGPPETYQNPIIFSHGTRRILQGALFLGLIALEIVVTTIPGVFSKSRGSGDIEKNRQTYIMSPRPLSSRNFRYGALLTKHTNEIHLEGILRQLTILRIS
jgi:hypothetical protein